MVASGEVFLSSLAPADVGMFLSAIWGGWSVSMRHCRQARVVSVLGGARPACSRSRP